MSARWARRSSGMAGGGGGCSGAFEANPRGGAWSQGQAQELKLKLPPRCHNLLFTLRARRNFNFNSCAYRAQLRNYLVLSASNDTIEFTNSLFIELGERIIFELNQQERGCAHCEPGGPLRATRHASVQNQISSPATVPGAFAKRCVKSRRRPNL